MTTTFLSPGGLLLYALASSGLTNVLPVSPVQWDDIQVITPQKFTVTRSLAKAHAVGAPVGLWTPYVVGL